MPDLIIFARGGGSLEELMPFNEPDLIKRVFKLKIPNISAIGHDTDYTLLDYVSDLRVLQISEKLITKTLILILQYCLTLNMHQKFLMSLCLLLNLRITIQ